MLTRSSSVANLSFDSTLIATLCIAARGRSDAQRVDTRPHLNSCTKRLAQHPLNPPPLPPNPRAHCAAHLLPSALRTPARTSPKPPLPNACPSVYRSVTARREMPLPGAPAPPPPARDADEVDDTPLAPAAGDSGAASAPPPPPPCLPAAGEAGVDGTSRSRAALRGRAGEAAAESPAGSVFGSTAAGGGSLRPPPLAPSGDTPTRALCDPPQPIFAMPSLPGVQPPPTRSRPLRQSTGGARVRVENPLARASVRHCDIARRRCVVRARSNRVRGAPAPPEHRIARSPRPHPRRC